MALKCLGYVAPRFRSEDLKAEDAIFFSVSRSFLSLAFPKRKCAEVCENRLFIIITRPLISSLPTSFESTKPKATKYEKETDMNSQVHRC